MEDSTQQDMSTAPIAAPTATTAEEDAKRQALMAWLVAPFYSYTLKNNSNEFVRKHAEASFYYGVASIAVVVLAFIVQTILGFLLQIIAGGNPFSALSLYSTFGTINGLIWLATWLFVIIPRVYGILKSQNMEVWSMPKAKELVSKYLKF